MLARIRTLAQRETDARIAGHLNREGLRTRMGLAWTGDRVHRIRAYHGIATACPHMPQGDGVRGDGLVSLGTAAARLGVVPTVFNYWRKWGYVRTEQHGPGSPLWVRWTEEECARLDGTRAAQGAGRWSVPEAQQALHASRAELTARLLDGELVAYRAHVGEHWEWRLTPAEEASQPAAITAGQGTAHALVATA